MKATGHWVPPHVLDEVLGPASQGSDIRTRIRTRIRTVSDSILLLYEVLGPASQGGDLVDYKVNTRLGLPPSTASPVLGLLGGSRESGSKTHGT